MIWKGTMSDDEITKIRRAGYLAEIARLKSEKPDNWKRQVMGICYALYKLDHPDTFGGLPSEQFGRKAHVTGCPSYDSMGDDSWP